MRWWGQPGVECQDLPADGAGILGYGGAVEAAWSIGRAQGQVALDSQSVTLSPDQAEGVQVAVEAVGDGRYPPSPRTPAWPWPRYSRGCWWSLLWTRGRPPWW